MDNDNDEQVFPDEEKLVRFNTLIDLFARGLTYDEILQETARLGISVSRTQLYAFKTSHKDKILNYIRDNANVLLSSIPIALKPLRIQRLNAICEKLEEGIMTSCDDKSYRQAAALTDTLLKAYRLVAEETNDITKVSKGMNMYVAILQNAPSHLREEIVSRLQELKNLIASSNMPALSEAIDATFVEENSMPLDKVDNG